MGIVHSGKVNPISGNPSWGVAGVGVNVWGVGVVGIQSWGARRALCPEEGALEAHQQLFGPCAAGRPSQKSSPGHLFEH